MTDAEAMSIALEEARLAGEAGDVPVGAVLIVDGSVVARAHNEREVSGDPTAHAELLALRRAASAGGSGPRSGSGSDSWRLLGATLVVTLEPCVMCAGALVAARIRRVVFGAYDPKGGACGSLYNVCVDPRLNHEVAVSGGVLEKECSSLLIEYFGDRRS